MALLLTTRIAVTTATLYMHQQSRDELIAQNLLQMQENRLQGPTCSKEQLTLPIRAHLQGIDVCCRMALTRGMKSEDQLTLKQNDATCAVAQAV